jgi:hypothetical protein
LKLVIGNKNYSSWSMRPWVLMRQAGIDFEEVLLRFDGFEPKSQGIKALLPHVDEFRPVHNLESLSELAKALSAPPDRSRDPFRLFGAVA